MNLTEVMVRVKQKLKRSDKIRASDTGETVIQISHFCTEK